MKSSSLTGAVVAVLAAMCVAAVARPTHRGVPIGKPRITITRTPSAQPGEQLAEREVSGTVTGAPAGARVVVYAQGDTWYVQPWADRPYTSISGGRWHTETHGGFSFVALLVTSGYRPAATCSQPPTVGGGVLAIAKAGPGK